MHAHRLPAALLLLALPALAQEQEVEFLELAPGLEGNAYFSPYEDADRKILAVLDMAKPGSTVYMSYYSLSYPDYPKKYKELAARGVRVRLNLFEGELEGTGKQPTVDDMVGKAASVEVRSRIDQGGDRDWFALELEGGVEYEFIATPQQGMRTVVRLIGEDGVTELGKATFNQRAALLAARVPRGGEYFVEVSADSPQASGTYALIARAHAYRDQPGSANVQGDPGDTAQTAAPLKLGKSQTDVCRVPNTRNPQAYASMHTKFTVVNDEIVITGSANLSASASLANHEHLIILKNKELAKEFLLEFEEEREIAQAMHASMTPEEWSTYYTARTFPGDWTSPSRGPNLSGRLKTLDRRVQTTLPIVTTGFSPEDWNEKRVVDEIKRAKKSIKIAMYSFVSGAIADAVRERALSPDNVEVIVLADDHQQMIEQAVPINEKLTHPKIRYLRVNNHLGNFSSLHHKYGIIDDEVVLGGSYNWTGNATYYNDENLTIIRSKVLAAKFNRDFAGMLAKYDPQGPQLEVEVPGDQTRVLFAVKYGPAPKGYDVVIVGDAPELGNGDPLRGLRLRGSRSVEPNLLASADLPRGKLVKWRVAVVKRGSFGSAVEGENVWYEQGQERKLQVRNDGVPMVLEETWLGQKPSTN